MRIHYKGRFIHSNRKKPKAWGMCDVSGFGTTHDRLVPQQRYSGATIINTGFLVNPLFYDIPNPQDGLLVVRGADPKPVKNARPDPAFSAIVNS